MARPQVDLKGSEGVQAAGGGGDMQRQYVGPNEMTGWGGWLVFAGVMMLMLGIFNAIDGLVALLNSSWLARNTSLPVVFDYRTWGWVWLIVGSVVFTAGFGVMMGKMWARIVGVTVATLNAIAQLLFIPAYPIWSISIIVVDVFVIYALTVHGSEVPE